MARNSQFLRRHTWLYAGLICITLWASAARFAGVSQSPPGFYIDEAAINAQVLCVQQSGFNLKGQRFPLFTEVLGGGYLTPTYLYPATAWVSVFGGSIESLRLFTAFFSLFFLGGVFVFAKRLWRSSDAAWLATLAAAISPWVFQFARIAWDPGVATAYLAWAFAALWGKRKWELSASGLMFALAAYSYPPLRVQIALTLPCALAFLIWRTRSWKPYLLTIGTALLISMPLIRLTLSGEIQGRFAMLSVFNSHYLSEAYGEASLVNGILALVRNFELLLSPSYLFLSGDSNLRHSTGEFGIWSWLDTLAVFTTVAVGLIFFQRRQLSKELFFVLFLLVAGYLAGILPAAMTWESNPHALRSIGATLFLAVGTGGMLAFLWRRHRFAQAAILGIAAIFFVTFLREYMVSYPDRAAPWFDSAVAETAKELAQEGRPEHLTTSLETKGITYDPMAVSYYELHYGVRRCETRDPRASDKKTTSK